MKRNEIYTFPWAGAQHFTCPACKDATKVNLSYEILAGIRNYNPAAMSVKCGSCRQTLYITFKYITRDNLEE